MPHSPFMPVFCNLMISLDHPNLSQWIVAKYRWIYSEECVHYRMQEGAGFPSFAHETEEVLDPQGRQSDQWKSEKTLKTKMSSVLSVFGFNWFRSSQDDRRWWFYISFQVQNPFEGITSDLCKTSFHQGFVPILERMIMRPWEIS